ncbi:MAG: peptidylprolyl isomerase [Nitrospirota bacterium]|jgi:FKBP-type peptidyl-prolyl cis-trans isomerase 2
MRKAGKGDNVKLHYIGKFEDGRVFDSSRGRGRPLELTLGQGRLIKGFENAVIGMAPGETKTVSIPPEEAYGPRREDLVRRMERAKLPPMIEAREGVFVNIRQPDGGVLEAVITEVTEDSVTLDANHPLAGQTLTFEIEVLEIPE